MSNKYIKKLETVEAKQFETNNEVGCKNMDDICIWINQGVGVDDDHCWHNGTDIFIESYVRGDNGLTTINTRCMVGDYIVKEQLISPESVNTCYVVYKVDKVKFQNDYSLVGTQ